MSAGATLPLLLPGLAFLALAVIKKLLVDEISGWLTSLSESLIALAATRIPSHADRYREEWLAELATLHDRRISGLRYALGVLHGSRALAVSVEHASRGAGPADRTASPASTPDLDRIAERLARRSAPSALARSRTSPQHFADFYDAMAPAVLRFFAARTQNGERAFDLTAETFAKAFEKREHFRGSTEQQGVTWLWGIARSELARYHRTRTVELGAMRRLGLERPPVSDAELHELERHAGTEAAYDHLSSALAELPAALREAIVLRFARNLSYPEIAEELGISREQARRRVSRALAALRADPRIAAVAEELRPAR
jgi:RNA polymerase sigma-70 factor (ECF subfamily)